MKLLDETNTVVPADLCLIPADRNRFRFRSEKLELIPIPIPAEHGHMELIPSSDSV